MPHRQTTILDKKDREELIKYIRTNDRWINYDRVNFNFFTDDDLLFLKKRVDEENESNQTHK
jgi:hypothetical protein